MLSLTTFIDRPLLALLPAGLFIFLWVISRSRWSLAAAMTWALYAGYEYGMKLRVLCSGECNIRVDLLLIYPALLVVSGVAIFFSLRRFSMNRNRSH